ncbi:MAG: leucine-rich repeat protein [Bacteroidaceae bacterium]|nr:leucine-rich repeat protein [Bacteroidaceae bacterium]
MSRSFFKNFMAALIFSCATVANAYDFEVNGIYYRIYGGNCVLVTFNWNPNIAPTGGHYAGNVVIPETVAYNGIDYSVTGIEYNAFYDCPALLSVKIPNSVTTIGRFAFNRCSGLTSIEIPSSVETIEEGAFAGCGALESIMVDENNVAYDSRNNCNALIETATNTLLRGCENTVIPHSVTSIGNYAFDDCITLTSIEIPNSVTVIGDDAFRCSGLTSIEIPNSVTVIGDGAFQNCSSLTSIEIPNSVTSIGSGAFSDCEALTDVMLPHGIICIGSGAFRDTPWYRKFSYDDDGCIYINNILFEVNSFLEIKSSFKVKEGTVAIAGGAFNGHSNTIKTIEIPNSVKAIGHRAFYYCSNLSNVNIPDGVTIIGNEAFRCTGLTSIKIPNGVTHIGYDTFSGCIALKDVEIPNSVTSIGRFAFYNCSSLTSIEIPESVKFIDGEAFLGTSIENVYITDLSAWCKMDYDSYVRMGDVYLNGEKIVHLVIPDDVKVFNNNCFKGNTSITSVKIGDNLESVGQFCFDGCNNIAEIYIESKDYLELYNAFEYNVKQNATVYLPKGQKDDYEYIFNPNNIVEVAHTLKYVIDGNLYKIESLGFGETISSINPIKEGHTFCGWEEHPATMPNNDLTVNGSFKVNQYTVTYLINGDIYKTETYDFGAAVLPIENLQRKGYTFSGWSQTLTTMPAMNVTIKSSLIANKYTIKYIVDGFIYATRECEYGELIQPLSGPFKNGYAFAGWSGLPERMPANDIAVTADFVKSDTAIDDVNSDAADVVIYDLNGNRITNPTTGVYIINGKKVFVK